MMLADTNRPPSSDLTMTDNPAVTGTARAETPAGTGLPPPASDFSGIVLADEGRREDTNAVVSPTHKDFLLTRIGGAFVALPFGLVYVGVAQLSFAISWNTYYEGDVSPLTQMTNIGASLGTSTVLLCSYVSLRRVTGTGAGRGQLAALGAGEVKISERARHSLGRAHVWIFALTTVFCLAALVAFATVSRVGTRSVLTGRLITARYSVAVFAGGIMLLNFAFATFPWWHSLKSASSLVADSVAETRRAIERYNPTSPEWQEEVLPRVLGLCNEILPLLSSGYGLGVAGFFLGYWLIAAAWFAGFLENGSPGAAFWTVVAVLFPLGVSYDVASASSDCDLLSDTLTEKRMCGDPNDQAFEHAVRRIELILDRQNTKQGLGFTVGYRVMDLKTLNNILAGIAGFATTAVPILFSLRPSKVETGNEVCSLDAPLVASIQASVAGMGNESCSYNMTLSQILGM